MVSILHDSDFNSFPHKLVCQENPLSQDQKRIFDKFYKTELVHPYSHIL
jgi:hypothetical protein